MKQVKSLFPSIHFDSMQLELVLTIVGALFVACSIGTVMVMIVSRF